MSKKLPALWVEAYNWEVGEYVVSNGFFVGGKLYIPVVALVEMLSRWKNAEKIARDAGVHELAAAFKAQIMELEAVLAEYEAGARVSKP